MVNIETAKATKGNILIVDDTPNNLRVLSATLTEQGYEVRSAINGTMALMGARAEQPDLIFLDINMPDMNGYEVCQKLKADGQTAEIPIIFISALDETLDKVKAFEVGGADYICKPFQVAEVLARVDNQINLLELRRQLQQQNIRLQEEIIQRNAAEDKVLQLNADLENRVLKRTAQLREEMRQRQEAQEKLLHMALHDPLTDLPNRACFIKGLEKALKQTQEQADYCFAVLFLDCDRFKVINDSLGHFVGDQLLKAIGSRLASCLPVDSMLARLGADEFTILLDNIQDLQEVSHIAETLLQKLKLPFKLDRHEVFINASIGIVLAKGDYEKPEHLLRDADIAMYRAKAVGNGHYQVFDRQMHAEARERLQLETDLWRAVDNQEFVVHYQPIVALSTGKITGFEALVRWQHPKRGIVSPGEFIPCAEETGLIIPMGNWVLREATHVMSIWQKQYGELALSINVNLSVKQFSQPNLIEEIDQIIRETGLDPRSLKLEITESAIMDNARSATDILQQLRKRKIELCIDDFGTGYSSLSYLHRFPMDILKIDRSFIMRLDTNGENTEIIRAIAILAHHLGMTVTAEGIETAQQLERVKALGCESAQGYFFSKPLDRKSAELLIASL